MECSTPGVSKGPECRGMAFFQTKEDAENINNKLDVLGCIGKVSTIQVHSCANCGKHDFEKIFKVCSKCRNPKYCSKECQRENWNEHKHHCC